MPMAMSRDRNITLRPNSEPTKTISPDMRASRTNVLIRFPVGCQVMAVSFVCV